MSRASGAGAYSHSSGAGRSDALLDLRHQSIVK